MEILVVLAVGVMLFLGIRMLMQRQAQKLNDGIKDAVTPENARKAALALSDEQHREVYRAIGAEDGRRALAIFKQSTGAPIKDCIIAVQALHAYPQQSPSELRAADELGGSDDAGFGAHDRSAADRDVPEDEVLDGELVEDVIDGVRDDAGSSDRRSAERDPSKPLGEADPQTGEIIGENPQQIPNIPGGAKNDAEAPHDVDARAKRLMEESGFNPEDELTIPADWDTDEEEMAGFHLEVQRGDEKITLSHDDLEPWVHDQLYALLRDDLVDEAAELLSTHSPLTKEEARKFLVVFKNQT
ncbi:hypothetical protein [Nesterenkonia jeotgali]|uniref:Uncharacterized protein n=1 Tax=Nesterenkonia jeotgali TaxID=317018 RepID=A0A839FLT3_9MICC|nr:hypothetical protein [Nesterenkonia jeotgali]MBA8922788.1 hypothetical protein [Nesterenkonia jeotgali]